ncbi:MAG TPA: type IV pilus twitching motility protein PilT [Desulfomonilaceae bacterium]|nr:type IV pilus twitching motility protein PilT [Desulfomonilaceae bacterium]
MANIDILLTEMIKSGASDLHMAAGLPPMLRLKGDLVPTKHPQLTHQINEQFFFEILSPEQQRRLQTTLELDQAYEIEGLARFRCNYFYQLRGVSAVFRQIPTKIKSLDDLGMPAGVSNILKITRGLILVTGPTGSGKSTTLAAIIDHINNASEQHVITIEDPLEFVHENRKSLITQREIGTHARSFSDALRVASREDPDIILVGEMRDLETISLALTCSELGILVFGTLHTNSAVKTIDRIINAFPANQQNQIRSMLSDSVKAILAQQLLKTADGHGRCAAVEILISSPAVGNMIRENKLSQIASVIQTGTSEGMQTMDQALQTLVDTKRITPEAAYWKAIDKTSFANQCSSDIIE